MFRQAGSTDGAVPRGEVSRVRQLEDDRAIALFDDTGTSLLRRSASVASARTQRDLTDRGDQSTMTLLAAFSAFSMTSSKVSPARRAASHQTVNPSPASPSAKRRAASRSDLLYERKTSTSGNQLPPLRDRDCRRAKALTPSSCRPNDTTVYVLLTFAKRSSKNRISLGPILDSVSGQQGHGSERRPLRDQHDQRSG